MDGADSSNERVASSEWRVGESSAPPVSPTRDSLLATRLAIAIVVAFTSVAAVTHLDLVYSRKFYDVTGEAQWIWAPERLSRDVPIAFAAVREFDLPPNRQFTRIKILGDPEYTLWFNGQEIGGRFVGEERQLDVYDVSSIAKDDGNRLVVSVRSRNGVGGLIAAVDIAPEAENFVVTDSRWKIYDRWQDQLPLFDVAGLQWTRPMLLGAPPAGRWNYLAPVPGKPIVAVQRVRAARETFEFRALKPVVRIQQGVAVAGTEPTRATAFDFGEIVDARLRLTTRPHDYTAHVIQVRFANTRNELFEVEGTIVPFVFAAGEGTVLDPETRHFRYAMVYGAKATAEIAQ